MHFCILYKYETKKSKYLLFGKKKIFYDIYISLNTCVLNTHKVNEFIYSGKWCPSIESLNFLLFLAESETYDIYLIFEQHVPYIEIIIKGDWKIQ